MAHIRGVLSERSADFDVEVSGGFGPGPNEGPARSGKRTDPPNENGYRNHTRRVCHSNRRAEVGGNNNGHLPNPGPTIGTRRLPGGGFPRRG